MLDVGPFAMTSHYDAFVINIFSLKLTIRDIDFWALLIICIGICISFSLSLKTVKILSSEFSFIQGHLPQLLQDAPSPAVGAPVVVAASAIAAFVLLFSAIMTPVPERPRQSPSVPTC